MIRKITENPLRYSNFRVRDGQVFKKVKRRDGEPGANWKWVVARGSRAQLLKRYHDDAATGGHLGVYKTYHKLQNNHTWPRMRADVCRYVRSSVFQRAKWALAPKSPGRGRSSAPTCFVLFPGARTDTSTF
jgi:hypothetical protein